MRKEVFGLTRKELVIAAVFVAVSFSLIIYSSIKLIHKHYTNNSLVQTEIQNQSKCLAYLNDLNTFTLNTQRSSVNSLVYRNNLKELTNFKKNILNYRDSLSLKLDRIDNVVFSLPDKKNELLKSGMNYLTINAEFLKMLNDSASIEVLSNYNLEKMRPAVRSFIDLIRKNSKMVVEKIQTTNANLTTIFNQLEFWLLLIGLAPYIYFFYRIIVLILRMILWEIFS